MAHDGIEVELKFQIKKNKFEKVENKVKNNFNFLKKVKQKDTYFNHPKRDFTNPETPKEWLSIRKRGNTNKLNYKHFYENSEGKFTHCDEIEFKIENIEKMKKLFKALGFEKLVTVEKKRHLYKHKNKFEIVFDEVKDLGHFIEIESLKNFGNVKKTRKKLFEFSKSLGIKKEPDQKGYPYLLMEQKGLIK